MKQELGGFIFEFRPVALVFLAKMREREVESKGERERGGVVGGRGEGSEKAEERQRNGESCMCV